MKVIKIVNSVFTSNTFLLTEQASNNCWLVDVGDIEPIIENIGHLSVKGVFITHTHYDHIYGLEALLQKYPECIVYTSRDGKDGLASDKFNFSRYHGDPITYTGDNIRILDDGDSVEVFDKIKIYAMATPGHDKSSMTFYTDEYVFTGDSFIPGFDVVATFPRSDKADSAFSLEKIHELLKTRIIFPGHQ